MEEVRTRYRYVTNDEEKDKAWNEACSAGYKWVSTSLVTEVSGYYEGRYRMKFEKRTPKKKDEYGYAD